TQAGHGSDVISEILDRLIIYTATHFRTEEGYFVQFEYAESEEHKLEHATFIEKVAKFSADLNRGSEEGRRAVAGELMNFLELWWKYHILETDMKYAKLFKERGLK
ncbi:MAG: bacteriohemerythrin, partial [Propionivibrio sp.]